MHRNVYRCALAFHFRDLNFRENMGVSLIIRKDSMRVMAGMAKLLARKVLAVCS